MLKIFLELQVRAVGVYDLLQGLLPSFLPVQSVSENSSVTSLRLDMETINFGTNGGIQLGDYQNPMTLSTKSGKLNRKQKKKPVALPA